jgi:hypothetical protein
MSGDGFDVKQAEVWREGKRAELALLYRLRGFLDANGFDATRREIALIKSRIRKVENRMVDRGWRGQRVTSPRRGWSKFWLTLPVGAWCASVEQGDA